VLAFLYLSWLTSCRNLGFIDPSAAGLLHWPTKLSRAGWMINDQTIGAQYRASLSFAISSDPFPQKNLPSRILRYRNDRSPLAKQHGQTTLHPDKPKE
jgi:hypothetical protein